MENTFSFNDETAPSGLKQLRATIDELSSLQATCEQAIQGAEALDKTQGFNDVAVGLLTDCRDFIKSIIPKAEAAIGPVESMVPKMIELREEISKSKAGMLGNM